MIQFNKEPEEPGRNDPCPCGSKKKYKKCCMKVTVEASADDFLESKVDCETMLKLLYTLVRGLKQSKDPKKAALIVTKRTVDDDVPDDWMEKMSITPGIHKDIPCYMIYLKPDEDGPEIIAPPSGLLDSQGHPLKG